MLRKSTKQPKKKSEDLNEHNEEKVAGSESREEAVEGDSSVSEDGMWSEEEEAEDFRQQYPEPELEEEWDEEHALDEVLNGVLESFSDEDLEEMFRNLPEEPKQVEMEKEETVEEKPEPMQEMPKIQATGLNQPIGEARKIRVAGNYDTNTPSEIKPRVSGKLEGRIGIPRNKR